MRFILAALAAIIIFAGSAKASVVEFFSASVQACNYQASFPCASEISTNPNIFVSSLDVRGMARTSGSINLSYGSLALDVSAQACCDGIDQADIGARASFFDFVTVFGGSGTGLLSYVADEQTSLGADPHLGSAHQSYSITSAIPGTFIFGQPFAIEIDATASAFAAFEGVANAHVSYSLTSISVLNAAGDPLVGYSYIDDSGAAYPFVGGSQAPGDIPPVPEPSSMILGALGLILGVCCRKRLLPGSRRSL